MDIMLKLNPQYYEFFYPLVEWKVLSVTELYKLSGYQGRLNSFHKLISRFEKHEVVKSLNDLWSRRKYIYLTRTGEKLINHEDYMANVSEDHLLHDMRLAEIVLELKKYTEITHISLEHHGRLKGEFSSYKRICPDASITGTFFKKHLSLGLELELSQKSKDRIYEKFKKYAQSNRHDYCIYLFGKESILRSYHDLLAHSFKSKEKSKFLFFHLPQVEKGKFDLLNAQGIHRENNILFKSLFEGEAKKNWLHSMGEAIKMHRDKASLTHENSCEFSTGGPDSPPTTS